jgi:exopolysaccharide transport family protein
LIINVLLRRWPLIAAATLICLALGILYLVLSPARYTATATMIIDTKRPQLVANDIVSEGQVDQAAVDSQIETMRSEKVATRVVSRLELGKDPEFVGRARGVLGSLTALFGFGTSEPSDSSAFRAAVANFGQGLRVTRVARSYAVDISFSSLDPVKAGRVANEIADAYINDQLEAKFETTQRASLWLQQRIAELRDQASDAYKAVQDFKQQNNIIIDASTGKLSTERELDELTSSLARARADTSQAEARYERIRSVMRAEGAAPNGLPDPAVTDALSNQVITRLRQQYLDSQKQEADYALRYGRNHQSAVNLRNEMAGLQRAIWDEVRRIGETYKSELEIARSREISIDARLREVFQQSTETRQNQVKLRELETSAATYRSIYETFLNRYTQVVQQQSFPATEARVITAAGAGSKTAPKVGLTLALAVLAGLGFGVGAAFASEHFDRVVRTPQQLESAANVACLGAMPLIAPATGRPVAGFAQIPMRKLGAAGPLLFVSEQDPFSPAAELLRTLKVTVDLNRVPDETPAVAIVSCLPGEGKTTVAANLAAMIGETGRSVLLIDGDLRNPSLSRSFGADAGVGLLDVLAGTAGLKDAIHRAAGEFDVLMGPLQSRPVHTAEILSSRAMVRLLAEAKSGYDYVLVDLPPLLPVVDVRAAASLFDSFLLVVEWGRTRLDELDHALRGAPLVRERLLGAVLNKVDIREMRRFEGYIGHSYAQYGYGYSAELPKTAGS